MEDKDLLAAFGGRLGSFKDGFTRSNMILGVKLLQKYAAVLDMDFPAAEKDVSLPWNVCVEHRDSTGMGSRRDRMQQPIHRHAQGISPEGHRADRE